MADFGKFVDIDNPDNTIISDPANNSQQASVSVNGDLGVQDGLSSGGVYGNLSMPTANTAYEAKVGVSRLSNRKILVVTALDDMFWGFNNSVTTSTGTPLYKNQQVSFAIDPSDSSFQIWLVASGNNRNARIVESP